MSREMEQGRMAEDMALVYLLNRGFVLKERNWRVEHKEIDLIMESENYIHVIEVKSLKAPAQLSPFEHVDKKKQNNIVGAARKYIFQQRVTKELQFDIVSVLLYKSRVELDYIENAFFPIY